RRCLDFQASHWAAVGFWASGAAVVCGTRAALVSCGAGVSEPQVGWVDRPAVREGRLGTAVNGGLSAFPLNARVLGVAALSFWFIGRIPRICSTVRIMVICE